MTDDLPGMWEAADLIGGETDHRDPDPHPVDCDCPFDCTGKARSSDVRRLAAALAVEVRKPDGGTVAESWQELTRAAFAAADIPLPEDRFEAAWRATWQCAFRGGNFTLDARRILAAVTE